MEPQRGQAVHGQVRRFVAQGVWVAQHGHIWSRAEHLLWEGEARGQVTLAMQEETRGWVPIPSFTFGGGARGCGGSIASFSCSAALRTCSSGTCRLTRSR